MTLKSGLCLFLYALICFWLEVGHWEVMLLVIAVATLLPRARWALLSLTSVSYLALGWSLPWHDWSIGSLRPVLCAAGFLALPACFVAMDWKKLKNRRFWHVLSLWPFWQTQFLPAPWPGLFMELHETKDPEELEASQKAGLFLLIRAAALQSLLIGTKSLNSRFFHLTSFESLRVTDWSLPTGQLMVAAVLGLLIWFTEFIIAYDVMVASARYMGFHAPKMTSNPFASRNYGDFFRRIYFYYAYLVQHLGLRAAQAIFPRLRFDRVVLLALVGVGVAYHFLRDGLWQSFDQGFATAFLKHLMVSVIFLLIWIFWKMDRVTRKSRLAPWVRWAMIVTTLFLFFGRRMVVLS